MSKFFNSLSDVLNWQKSLFVLLILSENSLASVAAGNNGGTPALAAALLWKEEGKGEGDSVLLPSSAIDPQKMNARQPNTAGAIVEDDWQTIEKEYNK